MTVRDEAREAIFKWAHQHHIGSCDNWTIFAVGPEALEAEIDELLDRLEEIAKKRLECFKPPVPRIVNDGDGYMDEV